MTCCAIFVYALHILYICFTFLQHLHWQNYVRARPAAVRIFEIALTRQGSFVQKRATQYGVAHMRIAACVRTHSSSPSGPLLLREAMTNSGEPKPTFVGHRLTIS